MLLWAYGFLKSSCIGLHTLYRESHGHPGAFFLATFNVNAPLVLLHYRLADAQAQPCTPIFGGEKRVKDSADVVMRNIGASIGDSYLPDILQGLEALFQW